MNLADALPGLQAKALPRCTLADIFTIKDGLSDEDRRTLESYFAHFLPPKGPCVACGSKQGAADVIDILLGKAKFTWGLVNGEGVCAECGYPARAYHRNVGPLEFLSVILQYHPDELERRSP